MNYWPEFLTIVVAHALAVASPGPDFALVLRQSLAHGRRVAVWASIGIGCGIGFHVGYCSLGLGLLLRDSSVALSVAKYLGAAYLAWVGVQALRASPREGDLDLAEGNAAPTNGAAWTQGFIVNVLNPKAALFFIALYALRVSPTTPSLLKFGYGAWLMLATMAWFCLVSMLFTQTEIRRRFLRHGHWIDRALGVVFLAFAAALVLAKLG
ncbi:MAG: LysE family transporter [Candidatus Didemnitutus sp.]|nr:LysE family transporter [Candidatus Didemnitutus sp.]